MFPFSSHKSLKSTHSISFPFSNNTHFHKYQIQDCNESNFILQTCEDMKKYYLHQYGDLYIEGRNVVKDDSN